MPDHLTSKPSIHERLDTVSILVADTKAVTKGRGGKGQGGGSGSGSGSGSSAQQNWRGSSCRDQRSKVRGATNAVDSLARGKEVFTVLDFVTTDQLQLLRREKMRAFLLAELELSGAGNNSQDAVRMQIVSFPSEPEPEPELEPAAFGSRLTLTIGDLWCRNKTAQPTLPYLTLPIPQGKGRFELEFSFSTPVCSSSSSPAASENH
jgi:hypothetical protein